MAQFLKVSLFLFTLLFFLSCSGTEESEGGDFVPKPKGYNRIDLPEAKYQKLTEDHPYSFEYSKEAIVRADSSYIAEPHWIHIIYPKFNADIQVTYKGVANTPNKTQDELLGEFIDDAHKLKSKHYIKAEGVREQLYETENGKVATIFELEGDVPSQYQFYVTDSSKHFLRGAVYFKIATKNDSLAPIIEFMKKDVVHLLNTLQWDDEEK